MRKHSNANLVQHIVRDFEARLLGGQWKPGLRLPSERELAEQLSVSRGTVREALQRLAARGLLVSRQGSGVFVTDALQAGFISPWRQLMTAHPELRGDMLEFRRVLEGAAAYFAALRAEARDLAQLAEILQRLRDARAADARPAEAQADAQFHEAIAHASHNTMFHHLHNSVITLLREHIALNNAGLRAGSDAGVAECLLAQHESIHGAIAAGDADAARAAMWSHIDYVQAQLERRATGTPAD
ncbi:MAG: FadR family transcriptional regulator [Rhodocyclaceae bacterium]|nr:FadR family transcriptional regulator [Rhodocyclaceae bacterium]MBX3668145.1 FadR family transcriptional regulator [Rhodocyclaceae bacterium]